MCQSDDSISIVSPERFVSLRLSETSTKAPSPSRGPIFSSSNTGSMCFHLGQPKRSPPPLGDRGKVALRVLHLCKLFYTSASCSTPQHRRAAFWIAFNTQYSVDEVEVSDGFGLSCASKIERIECLLCTVTPTLRVRGQRNPELKARPHLSEL